MSCDNLTAGQVRVQKSRKQRDLLLGCVRNAVRKTAAGTPTVLEVRSLSRGNNYDLWRREGTGSEHTYNEYRVAVRCFESGMLAYR